MKTLLIILFILTTSQANSETILNQRIKDQIKYWKSSKHLEPSIKRASKYIGIVLPIIKEYGLPEELALLPILESGYKCNARSKVGALGCWQFMSATGKEYGLNKTVWSDTRIDIKNSTIAACQYLKWLFKKYGDWSLALAAYNYGQGRLDRAIKREKVSSYWDLTTIPAETKDYVPKLYALFEMDILKRINSEKLIEVKIKGVQSFSRIAGVLRIKTVHLQEINQSFTTGSTPPGFTTIYLSPIWNRAGLCSIGIAEC